MSARLPLDDTVHVPPMARATAECTLQQRGPRRRRQLAAPALADCPTNTIHSDYQGDHPLGDECIIDWAQVYTDALKVDSRDAAHDVTLAIDNDNLGDVLRVRAAHSVTDLASIDFKV